MWQTCGGVARNVAHCLAVLADDSQPLPLLISVVGKDSMGAYLERHCEEIGSVTTLKIVLSYCYVLLFIQFSDLAEHNLKHMSFH